MFNFLFSGHNLTRTGGRDRISQSIIIPVCDIFLMPACPVGRLDFINFYLNLFSFSYFPSFSNSLLIPLIIRSLESMKFLFSNDIKEIYWTMFIIWDPFNS